ncbi:hypothetical protein TNCV_3484111 [Trichonephila clavipes]|nr:hypothetical protein TNCV_3484111 [Trichonephila clavipes]
MGTLILAIGDWVCVTVGVSGSTESLNSPITSKASPAPPRTSPMQTETTTQYGRRVRFRLPISSRQPPSTDSEEEWCGKPVETNRCPPRHLDAL